MSLPTFSFPQHICSCNQKPVYFCFGCKTIVPTKTEKVMDVLNEVCAICLRNNIAQVTKQQLIGMSLIETDSFRRDRYQKLAETFN